MNGMNFLINKNKVKVIFGIYVILQFLIFRVMLSNMIDQLYVYENGKKVLGRELATNLGDLLRNSSLIIIFYFSMIGISILPVFRFYPYYLEEKSIYTLLRLPGKKARLKLYVEQVWPSIAGNGLLWLTQLFIFLLFFGMYLAFVPGMSQPEGVWRNLWSSSLIRWAFPMFHLQVLLRAVSVGIFLPCLVMLLILAERSKGKGVLAFLWSGIAIYGMYVAFQRDILLSSLLFFGITLCTMAMGIYYIYCKQIV